MGNQLLNENLIRQRSAELEIRYENLLAAAILEEIVKKIAESKCRSNFWIKDSLKLNLERYRKKVDLTLSFFIQDSKSFHYKKEDVSQFFAELFRNLKKNAVHWNYQVWMEQGFIFIDVKAKLSSIQVPVKMKLEPLVREDLQPYIKEMQLFTNNCRKIKICCYPSEYVVTEKFLEILDKLELLNEMSCYLDIYEILKRDMLSGRKVWESLYEGCKERNIKIEKQRFDLVLSYRDYPYMEKKWKAYLRRQKRKLPGWDEVIEIIERFFGVVWEHMCMNVVYLGDWMPELCRCIE